MRVEEKVPFRVILFIVAAIMIPSGLALAGAFIENGIPILSDLPLWLSLPSGCLAFIGICFWIGIGVMAIYDAINGVQE